MPPNLHTSGRLRPVDLARAHGLSAQAVRNYEAAGILPAAERTPHGHRVYTPLHAAALRAFLALARGHGHGQAASIMRAANRDAVDEALRLVDESHAQLVDDRRTLHAVEAAVADLEPVPHEPGDVFVGALSRRLGIRPATLRKWERAGVVRPSRDPATGYRRYGAADVRDVLLAHQLRRGGHLLAQISQVIAQVRSAGGVAPLESMLRDWRARLSARSRAMLGGAAALDAYLDRLRAHVAMSSARNCDAADTTSISSVPSAVVSSPVAGNAYRRMTSLPRGVGTTPSVPNRP